MNRIIFTIYLILYCNIYIYAHGEFIEHGEDIMAVLGLEYNVKIFSRSKDTKNNTSWAKFISSDMIDQKSFHKKLEEEYPGFKISSPNRHRLLFHWAFDTEPWNNDLEKLFKEYCDIQDLNIETNIRILKSKLITEQKERNRKILKKTQEVFGLESGGTQRKWSYFFASMAYNVHILGDYMSDNKELGGLYEFDKLIGNIVTELRKLDYNNSKQIIKGITQINNKKIDVQKKADLLMEYLKKEVPHFIQIACNGSIKRIIEGQGYKFTKKN